MHEMIFFYIINYTRKYGGFSNLFKKSYETFDKIVMHGIHNIKNT